MTAVVDTPSRPTPSRPAASATARVVRPRSDRRARHARFGHQPALDGLRGLSVAMVLCFHGGWSWMSGGYVGVSVFFTLSGFLITRLLLDEHDVRGRINVVRFWGRRLRRLMPASVVCLLAVSVLATLGLFGDVPDLGRDLRGAVLQIANWTALTGNVSYGEQVLGQSSPLDHMWSLAIEEQFYWLWPLVLVAVLRRRRPHRAILAMTAGAVAAAPVIAVAWGPQAAYWATPARIGEILVGASVAALLHRRRSAPPRAVALAGPPAIGVIGWAAVAWPPVGGPAYGGWLPVFAVATGALLLAIQVRSPLRRLLAWRPLVALGVISYGAYLYHWPIFVLVDGRLGDGWLEFAVEVAVTLALARWSYRCLERPIRRGRGDPARLARTLAFAAVVVLAVSTFGAFGSGDRFADPASAPSQLEPVTASELAPVRAASTAATPPATTIPVVASVRPSPVVIDGEDDAHDGADRTVPAATAAPQDAPVVVATPGDETITVAPSRPVRILVVGDSTAWSVGDGLAAWAEANPSLASVTLTVAPGCGFVGSGTVPADDGSAYRESCERVLGESMLEALSTLQPDVVLLMVTRTDVKDRLWSDEEGVLPITDARAEQRITDEYATMTRWILGTGVPEVVWVKPPAVRPDPAPPDEMADPARIAVLHRVIDAAVAAGEAGRVSSVDLAGWYAASAMDDRAARVDGMHFEVPAATEIASRLLGPRLINTALAPS